MRKGEKGAHLPTKGDVEEVAIFYGKALLLGGVLLLAGVLLLDLLKHV